MESFAITFYDSEHLSVHTTDRYGQDKNEFAQGERVIVKIDGLGGDYAVAKLEYGTKGADSLDHWTYVEITDIDNNGNYYFTMPYVTSGGSICIRIAERNMAVLSGYNLVGSYLGVEISNASNRDFDSFNDGAGLEIAGDGSYSYKNKEGLLITGATAKTGEGVAAFGTSTRSIYYSDRLVYGSTYPDSEGAFGSFDYLGVKKENASDEDSIYSVKAESFLMDGRTYIAIASYKNNTFYAGGFIDKNGKKAYLDVSFEYLYGEKLTDSKVIYNVKKGDEVLYTISSKLDGGASNRFVPTAPYGVYSGEGDKSLILFGDSISASYDGDTYNLALGEDNTFTLTLGLRSITGTIDDESKTFIVLTDVTAEAPDTPKFAGSTYIGTIKAGDENMYWGLSFSEDGSSVTSKASYTASLGYAPYLSNNNQPMEVTYDFASSSVTFALKNFSDSPVTMNLTYDFHNDAFTCNNAYSSFYDTKNAVLAKQA